MSLDLLYFLVKFWYFFFLFCIFCVVFLSYFQLHTMYLTAEKMGQIGEQAKEILRKGVNVRKRTVYDVSGSVGKQT